MGLASGTMVNANLRLIELLGRGGMGSVWLADHLGLEAQVAVKFIQPDLVWRDPSLRERFRREASICAQLRSIHVVQTFDVGEMADGSPYITMELLEGTNLTDHVETRGPLTIHEVGKVVQQVCKVLHRAHDLDIIHRDIKPDNIFLMADSDYDFFVKVLDFGIAKQKSPDAKGAVTKTGEVVGTPEFMSPEQAIASKHLDHRSDLYSLGVVAFYALTGELPFELDAEDPLWLQATKGRHMPATRLRPDLFDEIDDWFDRALQARPEHRYQSARDMANALSRIISDNTSQIMEPLSASLEDSLSLSRGESMDLRARLQEHIEGVLDESTSPIEPEEEAPAPTQRMSVPEQLEASRRDAAGSEPAMFDLMGGPDSEAFGREATVLMDERDHREAEVAEEGPPTVPRRSSTAPGPTLGMSEATYASPGDLRIVAPEAISHGVSRPAMVTAERGRVSRGGAFWAAVVLGCVVVAALATAALVLFGG